jgi:hypothetical protein
MAIKASKFSSKKYFGQITAKLPVKVVALSKA